jgi:hypothetical protein
VSDEPKTKTQSRNDRLLECLRSMPLRRLANGKLGYVIDAAGRIEPIANEDLCKLVRKKLSEIIPDTAIELCIDILTPGEPAGSEKVHVDTVPEPDDPRPEIYIGHETHEAVDQTSAAIAVDPLLFERDHELVTVILNTEVEKRSPIAPGTPIIRPVEPYTMLERLTRHLRFAKINKDGMRVRCQPDKALIGALLARGTWPIPSLVSISETPIFRPDGSISQTPGYDEATGYYYAPSCKYPEIPNTPDQQDACRSLQVLEDLFVDFPHVSRAHKLIPIAAILTILARAAIDGSVPGFVLDASTRGSGKTLQADVVSLVTLGRDAARLTYPESDEELEKVLGGYAIAGSRMILIDNITRTFGGGPLDKVLTARRDVELRILGASEIRRVPWCAVMMASGNNVMLGEDTIRRVLISRLESELDSPETRVGFKHDPLDAFVRKNRAPCVAHALQILRAYAVAGFPSQPIVPRWGSFEAWTNIVAGAIAFASVNDAHPNGVSILDCKPTIEERGDESIAALGAILASLPRLSAGEPIKIKNALYALYPDHDPHDGPLQPDGFDDLREAFEAIATPRYGQKPDARILANRLRRYLARPMNGRKLRFTTVNGIANWFVVDMAGKVVKG